MVKIPNLEKYVAIFPKGTGTGPVPKRVRKIPAQADPSLHCPHKPFCWFCPEAVQMFIEHISPSEKLEKSNFSILLPAAELSKNFHNAFF